MQRPERQPRDLRPALVFLSGELIAVPIPLEREEVILGRSLGADVRINDHKSSRRHAKISMAQNEITGENDYILTDFGSRNGTFLNGADQRMRQILHTVSDFTANAPPHDDETLVIAAVT